MIVEHWLRWTIARLRGSRRGSRRSRHDIRLRHAAVDIASLLPLDVERLESRAMLTTVSLDNGDLLIEDTNGGNTDDLLTIRVVGSSYEIHDPATPITISPPLMGLNSGTNTVSIADTEFAGIVRVRTHDGDDTINIEGLTRGLTIDAGGGDDAVYFRTTVTNTAGGRVMVVAEDVTVSQALQAGGGDVRLEATDEVRISADVVVTGDGVIDVDAGRTVRIDSGATISAVDGDISIDANQGAPNSGSFHGIDAFDRTTVQTSGSGGILIAGRGGDTGAGNLGVVLRDTVVSSSSSNAEAGKISITGTGGTATGVHLVGSDTHVTSVAGAIHIIGTGSDSVGHGVQLAQAAVVESTGTTPATAATITIEGTARSGSGSDGFRMQDTNAMLTSVYGDIRISGNGSPGTGAGIHIRSENGAVSSTGTGPDAADIIIHGTSGDGAGVQTSSQSDVLSVDGDIRITGMAAPGGNQGVVLGFGTVAALGSGALTIEGVGNGAGGEGIVVFRGEHGDPGGAGPVTLMTDTLTFDTSLRGAGALSIQPRNPATSIGLGGGSGTLNLSDTDLDFLADGFNSITIGDTANGTGTVDIDTATFTDPITIAGGTIHDGPGTDIDAGTNAVTLQGTVSPGRSPGILTIEGNVAIDTRSTFDVEITGDTPGTEHDQLAVDGRVAIGAEVSLTLSASGGFVPAAGDQFVIVDSTAGVTGSFDGLPEGAVLTNFLGSGRDAVITYNGGGDNNDVVIEVVRLDFGDAPDTDSGTGPGNYKTLSTDNGPSHTISTDLFLGATVDGESEALAHAAANGDDVDQALPDDEDGIVSPQELTLTAGAVPELSVLATNATGAVATLYGWIDYNRDGVFNNTTERAQVAVPDGTSATAVTLTFPRVPSGVSGSTFARFRLSTDAAARHPTGTAADGEVEDYAASIMLPGGGSVDSIRKISDSHGNFTGVLGNSELFGFSSAALGDLNGDGVVDVAVGSVFGNAVWILFLNTDGTVNHHRKFDNPEGEADNFGQWIEPIGDLDADGVIDIAVGAQSDNDGGLIHGAVWILFLNTDGTVKGHQKLSDTQGGFTGSLGTDLFGASIANLGDLDGDGVTDIAVGASQTSDGGRHRGGAWVLFLNTDGTVKSQQKISDTAGNFLGTLDNFDALGISAASLGDLDGDGLGDVAIGAPRDDDGLANSGAVWILFLNANGTVKSHQKISSTTGGFTGALDAGDEFGRSVDALGDLNGDGITDIAVGAYHDDDGGNNRGAVWILHLNSNGMVQSHSKISNTRGLPAGTTTFLENADEFGSSVSSVGDLNGDGIVELVVGAARDDDGGTDRGAVWILNLSAGTLTDFGDAPDSGSGTGTGNYNTLSTDSGPSHTISTDLFLGATVDGEPEASASGNGDDIDQAPPDDEDGVIEPLVDLTLTAGTVPAVRLLATNTTGTVATLSGWIDFNADGVFDNGTERAQVAVPDQSSGATFVLTFPPVPPTSAGMTYARFRLSTDPAAENPTGAAVDGEVEDHSVRIAATSDGHVQSHRKISSMAGGFNGNLANGGAFGRSVAHLGDLDGDGVDDIVVGSDYNSAVWVLFLNSDGTVNSHQEISEADGNFNDSITPADRFGVSMASLGDLDADGMTDIAVGAPLGNAFWVMFLNNNGTVREHRKITGTGQFGTSIAPLGDMDGDGVTDIAVGATDSDGFRGAVWVLFLNQDGTVKSQQKIGSRAGGFNGMLDGGDRFGFSISSLGDLDGDGVTDIAVSARDDDDGGTDRGAVWVLFLNADGTVNSHRKISDTQGGFTGTLNNRDFFGHSGTSPGDLDGDGVRDLVIGASLDDDGGPDRGAVWVLLLNSDGMVRSHQKISGTERTFGDDLDNIDHFGIAVASIGDRNGDGITDIAVGARGDDDGGPDRGALWLLDLGSFVAPEVNLAVDVTSADEASQTVVTVTATASAAVVGDQAVDLDVSGTGITGSDYSLSATTITIDDGQTSGSVAFTVQDDAVVELDFETATLTIENPSAGIVLGTTVTQDVTIEDNDRATVTLAGLNTTQPEGNSDGVTQFTFEATVDNAVQDGFRLYFRNDDGTATANDRDFLRNHGFVDFDGIAGEVQTIIVDVHRDDKVELDETFSVSLCCALPFHALFSRDDTDDMTTVNTPVQATIVNDDSATLSINDVSHAEGDSGATAFPFNVAIDRDVDVPVTVNAATANGSAQDETGDGDYRQTAGTLSLSPRTVSAGDPDITFGASGQTITDFAGGDDSINDIAIQNDGMIVAVGTARQPGQRNSFALARYKPDGSMDTGFGTDGMVVTTIGSLDDDATAVAIQSDGKIVVAGFTVHAETDPDNDPLTRGDIQEADIVVARYNPNGTLDMDFGTKGIVLTDAADGGMLSRASDLVIQQDGRIAVAGSASGGGCCSADFVVARYNTDGSLDAGFGDDGRVRTQFGTRARASGIAVQPDGRLVVVGGIGTSVESFGMARYNPGGELDTSFGTDDSDGIDGVVVTKFLMTSGNGASSVVLQPDGRIVVAGTANQVDRSIRNADVAVLRYNPDGSLDSGFGTDGKVLTEFNSQSDQGMDVILQPDGRIVVAGVSHLPGNGGDPDFAIARYNDDGSLHAGFGIEGRVIQDLQGHRDVARAITLDSNGDILVAGSSRSPSPGSDIDFSIARFAATGGAPSGFSDGISVAVNGDQNFESDETFFVDLSTIQAAGRDVTFAGNQAQGTIVNDDFDTTPPVVTIGRRTTTDPTPQLTGTVSEDTTSISVTVGGATHTATDNGDGTWTLADDTITASLAPGVHNVTVAATDLAGNTGTDGTTNELRIALFALDFGTSGSPLETGFARVLASDVIPDSPTAGDFGWLNNSGISERDRTNVTSHRDRDYHKVSVGAVTFQAVVPNGNYDVTFTIGSGGDPRHNVGVMLEGAPAATVTAMPGQFAIETHSVTVSDGILDLELLRQGTTSSSINSLTVLPASLVPRLDATDSALFHTLGDAPIAVDPALLLTDPNDVILPRAEVRITGGFVPGEDLLEFSDQLGITGSYDGATGVLTLTGTGPVAHYQAALRSVTFGTTGSTAGPRSVQFAARDATGTGFDSRIINVLPLGGAKHRFDFGDANSPVEPGFTAVDIDDAFDSAEGYGWLNDAFTNFLSARDRRSPDALRQDYHKVGSGSMTFAVSLPDGTYDVAVTIGSAVDRRENVGVFLEDIQVDTVSTAARQFATGTYRTAVSDGRLEVRLERQGSTGININSLQIVEVTADPRVDLTDDSAIFQSDGGAIPVDAELTIDDVDSANLAGATVSIIAGHNAAADTLLYSDQLGIAGNFDGASGVLTLSGIAPVADYQTALRTVRFHTADTSGMRTVDVAVDDGTDTGSDMRSINIIGPFTAARYDFGTPTSDVEPGFIAVDETTTFTSARGHGWLNTAGIESRSRTGPVPLDERRDYNLIRHGSMTFAVSLPNGDYDVQLTIGSSDNARNNVGVLLEGAQVDTISTAVDQFATPTHRITVSDNRLEVRLERQGASSASINALIIDAVP